MPFAGWATPQTIPVRPGLNLLIIPTVLSGTPHALSAASFEDLTVDGIFLFKEHSSWAPYFVDQQKIIKQKKDHVHQLSI
jgi:hypothetical protein